VEFPFVREWSTPSPFVQSLTTALAALHALETRGGTDARVAA